jgi:chromatin remodeling complex protein RSC6
MPKKATTTSAPSTASAPESVVVAPAVVASTKPKKSKASASATVDVEPVAPLVVEPSVSVEPTAGEDKPSLSYAELDASIKADQRQISVLNASIKYKQKLQFKAFCTTERLANKKSKRVKKTGERSNKHGFNAPVKISDELADFLSKEKGSELSRTETTKEIYAYILSNGLKDKSNGTIIHPDAKLAALLKIPTGADMLFIQMQKHITAHLAKKVKVEVVPAVAGVSA